MCIVAAEQALVAQAVHSHICAESAESDLQLLHRRVRVLESALIRAQRAELRRSRVTETATPTRSDTAVDRCVDGAKLGTALEAVATELTDAHKAHVDALCERHQARPARCPLGLPAAVAVLCFRLRSAPRSSAQVTLS